MSGLLHALRGKLTARAAGGVRMDGYLALEDYGALGDGRSVALSGADGSIDWWCVPNLDSPPLFDRLLDPEEGGRFVVTPTDSFTVERRYRPDSNVLETVFTTATGRAKLTESMNSGTAGRLPWAELGRRIEGLSGSMRFRMEMRPGRRADGASPYHSTIGKHAVFHVGSVLGLLLLLLTNTLLDKHNPSFSFYHSTPAQSDTDDFEFSWLAWDLDDNPGGNCRSFSTSYLASTRFWIGMRSRKCNVFRLRWR